MKPIIGLLFAIIIAILALAVVSVIGLATCAAMDTDPSQRTVQRVETTGDVRRLRIETRTGERVDAVSCDLIDPHTGGIVK